MNPTRILLVEDDRPLAELVAARLSRDGYEVAVEHRGDRATEHVFRMVPDLVILDVMLPGKDGLTICRELRPAFRGPILFFTAREDDYDQIAGLELGADDYLVKPVRPQVLIARVRALLRRMQPPSSERLVFDELEVAPASREVRIRGEVLALNEAEYELIEYLARNPGRVVDREELFQALRGIPYDGIDRSIDLRVAKLRRELKRRLNEPLPIRTVRGHGYLFAVDR